MESMRDPLNPNQRIRFGSRVTQNNAMALMFDEMTRQRKRAASLLCVGALFTLIGFLFTGAFTLHHHWYREERNFMNKTFESGYNYWPQTVSESVADQSSAAGKVFFGMNIVGAMTMLFSNYPWHLRNVFLGDSDICCCTIPYINLRTFMPPIGLLLVACVQMIPHANAGKIDEVSNFVHQLGAIVLLGGYCFLEGRTLGWFRCACCMKGFFKRKDKTEPDDEATAMYKAAYFTGCEWHIRTFINIVCLIFVALFQWTAMRIGAAKKSGSVCCDDVWVYPEQNTLFESRHVLPLDYHPFGMQKRMLLNTAHGEFYKLKVEMYAFELIAAVVAIFSHFTVWYYCEERKFKGGQDRLPGARELQEMRQEITPGAPDAMSA